MKRCGLGVTASCVAFEAEVKRDYCFYFLGGGLKKFTAFFYDFQSCGQHLITRSRCLLLPPPLLPAFAHHLAPSRNALVCQRELVILSDCCC